MRRLRNGDPEHAECQAGAHAYPDEYGAACDDRDDGDGPPSYMITEYRGDRCWSAALGDVRRVQAEMLLDLGRV